MGLLSALRPDEQRRHFESADDERSRWILQTPGVRRHEEELARSLPLGEDPVLEVGAGEGLLPRLRPELLTRAYVGLDLSEQRARRVRGREGLAAVTADASRLPLRSDSFGTVLCRDVLHHLEPAARARAVAEMARVLRPDGVCVLTEPNASRSPVVAAFSLAIPAERMALGFRAATLRALVAPCFDDVTVSHHDHSVAYRLLYHYRFGAPALARVPLVDRALRRWERAVRRAAPSALAGYVRLTCRGPR